VPARGSATGTRNLTVAEGTRSGPLSQRIGRAERLFVNGDGGPEYVRVRIGFLGARSVLILVEAAEVDAEEQTIVLGQTPSGTAARGPSVPTARRHRGRATIPARPRVSSVLGTLPLGWHRDPLPNSVK
jgi:hypothetical protein